MFAAAIGLSAFLLFTIQPLVFQLVLLGGYAYAHVIATYMSPRAGAAVHCALLVIAAGATALAPRDISTIRDPGTPVVLDLLRLLFLIVGPAAFMLTTTTPLVSSWYARTRQAAAGGRDPYWLYALSNGGSLLALLAYPLLIEPRIGLTAQRASWSIGFALLGVLLVIAALTQWAVARRPRPAAPPDAVDPGSERPTKTSIAPPADAEADAHPIRRRLAWMGLAAVPAGLLAAVTNSIATDLTSAPLLWVIPLAIYLASFMIAFSGRGRRVLPAAYVAAPAALTMLWLPIGSGAVWPILPLLVTQYLAFGVAAVAIHGRLAEARPPSRRLTEFYLLQSAGGALGGAFVAVVAPLAFDGVWELPILIVSGLVLLGWSVRGIAGRRPLRQALNGAPRRVGAYAIVAVPLLATMAVTGSAGLAVATGLVLVACLLLLLGGNGRVLVVGTAAILLVLMSALYPRALFRDRSFFGVAEVLRTGESTVLRQGTTIHGMEWTDPARRGDPGSYYARSGPLGDVFAAWNARPPGAIRVIGLGVGAVARYARPQDDLVFFEIDELVARVARDPTLFTSLADRTPVPEVRIGDGRLLLAAEPDDSLSLVMLDAFASDVVPAHLITREAIAEADRALRPDGLIVIQVSNRYYRLGPPVARALELQGLQVLERRYAPTAAEAAAGAAASHFIVGTRDAASIDALLQRGWTVASRSAAPLTDDFPDVIRYFGT